MMVLHCTTCMLTMASTMRTMAGTILTVPMTTEAGTAVLREKPMIPEFWI